MLLRPIVVADLTEDFSVVSEEWEKAVAAQLLQLQLQIAVVMRLLLFRHADAEHLLFRHTDAEHLLFRHADAEHLVAVADQVAAELVVQSCP